MFLEHRVLHRGHVYDIYVIAELFGHWHVFLGPDVVETLRDWIEFAAAAPEHIVEEK